MRCYCGGRGSSSGGGRFGKGGGKKVDVLSTTSMVSARQTKTAEVDQALTVARDIQNQYGINVEDLQIAKLGGKDQYGVMAYYDANGNLAYNEKLFNAQAMNKTYDTDVQAGFHPSRGNKTGIEAVVSHEMGHALTDEIGKKMGLGSWQLDEVSDRVLKQASKNAGYKSAYKLASKVSGYATDSKAEALAEAFADVYCNGRKASKESQAIVNVMNSYFK